MNLTSENNEKVDGGVAVSLSSDGLEAWVTFSSPKNGGEPVQIGQVLKALSAAGVREGLVRATLEDALERRLWGRQILAAKGIPGEASQAGHVQFNFPLPNEKLKPLEAEDGKVDFRSLNLIHNVKKGDVLAVRTPAVLGRPGLTVTGQIIQPQTVSDPKLAGGKNTELDATGCKLLAAADGHVTLLDGKVAVQAVFTVEGDVDFSVGNVDFVGNVLVAGDVKSGFVVKAGGDIEIRGLIEAAEVIAGGNLLVRNGIIGNGHCTIAAKGNILARYVEDAHLEAGGNVMVQDGLIRSQVKANGMIKAEGRRGEILGGRLQALEEISARVIGSERSIPTTLELGVTPKWREAYDATLGQFQKKKSTLISLERYIREYRDHVTKGREISEAWKRAITQRLMEYEKLNKELEEMEATVDGFEAELQRMQRGQVKAYDCVYPGVSITIGRATLQVQERSSRSGFTLEEGQMKMRALKYGW